MLSLESKRWAELRHAYGSAADIPALLRGLESLPTADADADPWFSLWSALAHQGDVYPASFAAVPHVVRVLASAPVRADAAFFQFPAWVEICRVKSGVEVPPDLREAYFGALAQLPPLVGAAAAREWDAGMLSCALAAIAAASGQVAVAEAVLELDEAVAGEFLEWLQER